jgi:hypothetical protein
VRFKLDENMPRAARPVLEAHRWDVHDVHEEKLAGAIDPEIRAACERENRDLVTLSGSHTQKNGQARPSSPSSARVAPAPS